MNNTKRKLIDELTQNNIAIITESDLEDEIDKINNIVSKCFNILNKTRHSFTNIVGEYQFTESIYVKYIEPSAPPAE